ncbi:MAG: hypothetical protein KJ601_02050 [Nanoarchaeota archaeon]|nr:hypothetical protein [Nanoarchaeota archaeon]
MNIVFPPAQSNSTSGRKNITPNETKSERKFSKIEFMDSFDIRETSKPYSANENNI